MKTCKDLNIKRCWYCSAVLGGDKFVKPGMLCSILSWKKNLESKRAQDIAKEMLFLFRGEPGLWYETALKEYYPDIYEKVNSLLILQ